MTAERRLLLSLVLLCGGAAHAATITVINTDQAGVGFNDPTPVTPVDGNPGTTLGAQRLYVFQRAAEAWGKLLVSNVEIKVSGSMKPLGNCDANGVLLGSAAPDGSAANFANAPRTNRAYPSALANSLAGTDLDTNRNDLTANFNVTLDGAVNCPVAVGWWYGVNDPALVPGDRIPLLPVVFHELGHGLGFTSQVGVLLGTPVVVTSHPPVWFDHIYDFTQAKHWSAMSSISSSFTNDPNVVWTGANVNRYQRSFLGPPLVVRVNTPAAIAGSYEPVQTAEFGTQIGAGGLTGNVVLVNDGVAASGGGTNTDGCEAPFTNAAAVAGRIALIDRGVCLFVTKVKNAQSAGAIGVIVANNVASGLPSMSGGEPTITIPSIGVTQALGTTLRNNLASLNLSIGLGSGTSGTKNDCVRLFAPNPVQPGSSMSHFHSESHPNLLMEPALNRSIFSKVDLTLELFRDIGWKTERDESLFADPFESDPCPVSSAP